MSTSCLFLGPSVYFGVDRGVPVLRQGTEGVAHQLQLGEAVALAFLSATGQRDQAAIACAAEIENGARWVDRVIDRYWSYFDGRSARPLDFNWLKDVNFDAAADSKISRRDAAPKSLIWLVTLACNRRCPYCYYDVLPHSIQRGHTPRDATFSKTAVLRMLAEMRRIGASNLYLTGGEPLLRSDIIDILNEAQRNRIRTHLSTKYPVDQILACQLKEARVDSITYSLDAGHRRLADGLAGDKGFFDQAVGALKALSRVGLDPEVNAVATRVNINRFNELAQLLVDCGIRRLSVSLFIPPPTHRTATEKLTPAQDDSQMIARIRELKARWSGELEIRLGDSARNRSATFDSTQPVCEVGYSELHVLPNGQACRCRYMPNETRLLLGSLEELTIMDIWRGEPLNVLSSPSRSMYQGTACESCRSFNRCNSRGRCFASALQNTGKLAAPDSFCQMGSIQ